MQDKQIQVSCAGYVFEIIIEITVELSNVLANADSSVALSPILIGVLLTLAILTIATCSQLYAKRRTKSNESLDHSKQSSSLLCNADAAKVSRMTKLIYSLENNDQNDSHHPSPTPRTHRKTLRPAHDGSTTIQREAKMRKVAT